MRVLAVVLVVGCTGPTPELATGRVKNLGWSGGLCQASFRCAGKLDLEDDRVTAHSSSSGIQIGTATLAPAYLDDLAGEISKIPDDQPLQGSRQGCAIDDSGGVVLGVDFDVAGFRSYSYPCGALGGLGPVVTRLHEAIDAFASCTSSARITLDAGCIVEQMPSP